MKNSSLKRITKEEMDRLLEEIRNLSKKQLPTKGDTKWDQVKQENDKPDETAD